MVELKGWVIHSRENPEEEKFYLNGVVYGHSSPCCADGTYIHTSSIKSITEKGDMLEFHTKNTVYTLKKQSILGTIRLNDDWQKDIINRCLAHFLGDAGNAVTQELWDIIQEKRQRSDKKAEALDNNQFWLALSSDCEYYFDEAIYKIQSGEIFRDEMLVHIGTFQDSVILEGCDVRYFPYKANSLIFYNTLLEMFSQEYSKDEQKSEQIPGYICNSGSLPLRVGFTWGKAIEIKPGETVPFNKAELEKYPDSELLSDSELYPAVQLPVSQMKILGDEND